MRRTERKIHIALDRIGKAAEEYLWCVSCCILDRIGADDRYRLEDFPEDLKDMAY